MSPQRRRTGRNAPTRDERERVKQLDWVLKRLRRCGITVDDIADTLGPGASVSSVKNLRRNLQAYSLGQRQAAERLLIRLIEHAEQVLARFSGR